MTGCCGVLCLTGLHSSAWATVNCEAVKECFPRTKINLLHNWLKQSFNTIVDLSIRRFIEVTAIVFNSTDSVCIVAFAPPAEMSHNIGDLVCHSLSLSLSFSLLFLLPLSATIERAAKKRLPYNSRCRGWGPHLGDIASLIPYCSRARSFLLYPLLQRLPRRKQSSHSWVSGMFNYLVKAQKGFQCPRIKVCIAGGIGSHNC